MMCKGVLPPFQEPLQLEIVGWAGRYAEVILVGRPRKVGRRQLCRCDAMLRGSMYA
jgi:hypothetical protein